MTVSGSSDTDRFPVTAIGCLLAPAGLNYVMSGATVWIYSTSGGHPLSDRSDLRFTVHGGERIPFSVDGLLDYLPALSLVGALLKAETEQLAQERAAIDLPYGIRDHLTEAGAAVPGSGIIEAMLTSAAILEAWKTWSGYSVVDYLSDMVNNGLVILLVEPS
ncbi:hypothetical protein ACFQO7_32085 [Catellatospora aurea]|uniref:Uncharacterized protein n=1 Tax=Catellatospora aurea TaxID=1337874 RepID=A0ABW2H9X5_9ACTN